MELTILFARYMDALTMLERRRVITTDPADARRCCGMERDEDGFCSSRPYHPIYVGIKE